MKKFLLLSLILFSLIQTSKASHILGGEIGWTCLPTGKYIFYMTTYRDCSAIPFPFINETITIVGSPLPEDVSGNPFSTIALQPDSNRWIAENRGDVSPECSNQYGNQYSCANRDQTAQQFFYKSSPITLGGNPNRAGWKFYWESECCRPVVTNVQTTGTMLLRAAIYRTKDLDDKDPCIDSSPRFIAYPTANVCRARLVNYSNLAIDTDLDSLVYSWSRPINPPFSNPTNLPYKNGYSPDIPTPDNSFDNRNIPATIDSVSGQVNMAVFSGTQMQQFITVTKVESYREGVKIAEVYREIPVWVINCDSLPNGKANQPPKAIINGDTTLEYNLTIEAGQLVKIPVEVIDTDYWDSLNTKQQVISLQPEGLMFSRDRTNPDPCQVTFGAGKNLGLEPCAYLQNQPPFLDTSIAPYAYKIQDTGKINTEFIWQTACSQLGINGSQKTFSFYLNVQDDFCPIPVANTGVIQITLIKNNSFSKASMSCIEELNGKNQVSWNYNTVFADNLLRWDIYGSKTLDGPYQLLDSIAANAPLSYLDSGNNQFYYVRAISNSCDSSISTSASSDTIKQSTKKLKLQNNIDCVQLTWDEERTSYPDNELRRFFVYRKTSSVSGYELIDSVINSNIYCDNVACKSSVSYYVEADTNSTICNYWADTASIYLPVQSINTDIRIVDNSIVSMDFGSIYQWYDCFAKKKVIGETGVVFTPKDTGSYAVILSKFGCRDTSACVPFFSVGLPEITFQEQISFYPNPTSGLVQINLGELAKEVTVQVRNIQGQLMKEERFNQKLFQLELPNAAGIYFIQLTNQKGERANMKVVKQ